MSTLRIGVLLLGGLAALALTQSKKEKPGTKPGTQPGTKPSTQPGSTMPASYIETSCGGKQLQRGLVAAGYNIGPYGVDGVIGKDTKAALAQWEANGSKEDLCELGKQGSAAGAGDTASGTCLYFLTGASFTEDSSFSYATIQQRENYEADLRVYMATVAPPGPWMITRTCLKGPDGGQVVTVGSGMNANPAAPGDFA